MDCDFCDGHTEPRRVRMEHLYRGRHYIVENVEAQVCTTCGERYYHARTLDAVDRMLDGEHSVKETLQVEVVSM